MTAHPNPERDQPHQHRPWRPTDPPCQHPATVPIEPKLNESGVIVLRRCLACQREVQR